MTIIHNPQPSTLNSQLSTLNFPVVASIGFFDGVHLGHRYLIEQVKEEAARQGICSAVITFPVHPRQVMNADYQPELLTSYEDKLKLLADTGIDYCIVLDFTPDIAKLTAWEFMNTILKERYSVQGLVIGHDHRFGHNRSEGFEEYCSFGNKLGINVVRAHACVIDNVTVSSSVIRRLLHACDITSANHYLGYSYSLEGVVVGGHRIGRTLGFPTANLRVDQACKLIPGEGVYAVRVTVAGSDYAGMLSIGHRPTLNNGNDRSIEVHILNFHSDIYNFPIKLSFVRFIRPDLKFPTIEELRMQLVEDKKTTEHIFEDYSFD